MKGSRIVGTGSCLPSRTVSNEEISRGVKLDPSAIFRRTGIRTRRWVTEGQTSAMLGEEAAKQALRASGLKASSIDGLLVSTTSPDMVMPSTACLLQQRMGVQGKGCFDISASCSGFLYALSMADRMIKSGVMNRCLVVATEVKSKFLDLSDESTAMLFADGAGAVVVTSEEMSGPSARGVLGVNTYADGSQHHLITVPAGGSRHPATKDTVLKGEHTIRIQGGALFRAAVRRLQTAVLEICKEFGVTVDEISQAVFHQANGRLLAALEKRLHIPPDKAFSTIERFGNTSSASLPIALDYAVQEKRVVSGSLLLLGAFGGGLTWATSLVRW